MSNLIGNPIDVLNTIKLCNTGNDAEALKMHNLTPKGDIPQGNIIDKFVTVANRTDNTASTVGSIIVSKADKTGDVDDATTDVVDSIKELSTQDISESALSLMNGVYSVVDLANALNEGFDDEVVPNAGFMANALQTLKTTASEWADKVEEAFADVEFRATDIYKYIVDNWVKAGTLTALGVIVCFIAYKMWKKNQKTTVEDVKNVVDNLPTDITNESVSAFYTLIREDDEDPDHYSNLVGTGKINDSNPLTSPGYYVGNKIVDSLKWIGDKTGLINRDEMDRINLAKAALTNDADAQMNSVGDGIHRELPDTWFESIKKSVSSFFAQLPIMTKSCISTLSAEIQGKQLYIGLVVSAIIAATGIYAIYKLRSTKNKTEEAANVLSTQESFNTFSIFFRKTAQLLKEDSTSLESTHTFYSKYIDNAADASIAMFKDPTFKQSRMYNTAEKCVSKLAAPYDEYLQDLSA